MDSLRFQRRSVQTNRNNRKMIPRQISNGTTHKGLAVQSPEGGAAVVWLAGEVQLADRVQFSATSSAGQSGSVVFQTGILDVDARLGRRVVAGTTESHRTTGF